MTKPDINRARKNSCSTGRGIKYLKIIINSVLVYYGHKNSLTSPVHPKYRLC